MRRGLSPIHFILISFITLLIFSCEEPFEFIPDGEIDSELIIHGFITQGSGPFRVEISRTAPLKESPIPVSGADVNITDETINLTTKLVPDGQGNYFTGTGDIMGMVGHSYYLTVNLENGRCYQSGSEVLPAFRTIDHISVRQDVEVTTTFLGVDKETDVARVTLRSEIPQNGEEMFIAWFGEETFQFVPTDFPDPLGRVPPPCYITQAVGGGLNLLTTRDYKSNTYTDKNLFFSRIDMSFLRKHIFSLYQFSTTPEFYDYLSKIQDLTGNTGSLFDTPPGRAKGNIIDTKTDQFTLGYFAAIQTDTTRVASHYADFSGIFVFDACEYRGDRVPYDADCRNCILIPRSSFVRPDFY